MRVFQKLTYKFDEIHWFATENKINS